MDNKYSLPPGWGERSNQDNPWANVQSDPQKHPEAQPTQRIWADQTSNQQHYETAESNPADNKPAMVLSKLQQTAKKLEGTLPKPDAVSEKLKQVAASAKTATEKVPRLHIGRERTQTDESEETQRSDINTVVSIEKTEQTVVSEESAVQKESEPQNDNTQIQPMPDKKSELLITAASAPKEAVLSSSDLDDELLTDFQYPGVNAEKEDDSEEDHISSLVILIPIAVVVISFLAGLLFMKFKSQNQQATEIAVTEIPNTVAEKTTVTTITDATTESTTVTTALTTTEETTTVTTAPKPTITNSYLYYINTGIGCKLYLHVDGDYEDYEYEVYLGSDKTDNGKNNKQEFLIAEGLGGGGISTYKALVTAWNPDHSQSVEQWAYINENLSDDGSVHPPQTEEYLFGGYVTGVKKSLNLRRKPSADSASLAEIPNGMQLGIYRADVNGWYWTEYNGLKGYVNAKFIKEIEPYDPFTDGGGNVISYIQGGDAPLRDYPADNGSVYTFIPDGTEVVLISREGDWFMVTYDGVTGYIHKSHTGW